MQKLKKLLAVLICAAMALTLVPCVGLAEETSGTCGSDLTWTLEDGVLTISGTGEMTSYASNSWWGTPAPWSDSAASIVSAVIEDGVTSVGNYAFNDCGSLVSVSLPDSLTTLGTGAFYWCESLASVSLPENVTTIGGYAFYGCEKLASITIPAAVTEIGNNAFGYYCKALASFDVDSNNESYASADGVLFNKDMTELILYPMGKSGYYEIPDGVTSIADGAFSNCAGLTGISFPEGVTSVNSNMFFSCDKLASVSLPESLTEIGKNAFYWCSALTSITIPAAVTSIGNGAFDYCDSLTRIDVDEGNDSYFSVDGVLFNDASYSDIVNIWLVRYPSAKDAASFDIPENTTSIGESAFEGCTSLKSIDIPDGVTYIGESAFEGCTSLKSIDIPDGVTSIPYAAFDWCESLASVSLPEGITSIDSYAFGDCTSLSEITLPSTLKSLGYGAFSGSGLTSVSIPTGLTYMQSGSAFHDCENLTGIDVAEGNSSYVSVDGVLFNKSMTELIQYPAKKSGAYEIPDGVTEVGSFECCAALTSLSVPASVTSISAYYFDGCSALTSINVAEDNSSYASVDGVLYNKGLSNLILYPAGRSGVCEIPASVTTISTYYAFKGCSALTGINVAEDNSFYTSIDGVLFNKDLTELILCPAGKSGDYEVPDGVTTIDGNSFNGCALLTSISIPASVTTIDSDYNPFYECAALTSISVAEDNEAYASVDGVLFNKNLTELAAYPSGRSGAYEIPDGVTEIGNYAFYGCAELTSVTVPVSVTEIGAAFFECESLTDVYYGGTAEQWASVDINVDGNEPLTEAAIHYSGDEPAEPEIKNVSANVDGENITVTATIVNVTSAKALAVGYGADGECVSVAEMNDETATLPADGAKTVKVFVWESIASMRPLCEAKEVTVK